MAHAHNLPKTEQKPEFTDYTVAGTDEGRHSATLLRINYEAQQTYTRTGRSLRRMCRKTAADCSQVRRGYPTKREPDPERIRNKGVPHSKFLKRFKIIERLVGTGFGDFVWVAKVYVLHATRGWKLYA